MKNIDLGKVVLVRASEWEGIYVDGKLVSQNHSIDFAEAIGINVQWLTKSQDEMLCDQGSLPENLEDLEEWL